MHRVAVATVLSFYLLGVSAPAVQAAMVSVELLIIGFLIWALLNATDYGGAFMGDKDNKAAIA